MFFTSLTKAQTDFEIGFGVLGSGIDLDPIPVAYRNDFTGPITYLGYYLEASTVLSNHNKWSPRAIVRLQTEGSQASTDWPEIRVLNTGGGVIIGYHVTPVITILAGGVALYKVSSRVDPIHSDQPMTIDSAPWSGRLNAGVRGNFGRWSSEMIFEQSFTNESGAVLLTRDGSPSFVPTYSYLNVRLGLKYNILQAKKRPRPQSTSGRG